MRLILCLFLTILSFSAGAAALSFRDLAPGDVEFLKKELPQLFEKNPNAATYDQAIKKLVMRGTYENVYLNRLGPGNYEILGKPIRLVEQIKFSGVDKVSESDLRALIDFKVGDRFDRKKAVTAAEKMKNFYGEHGYFNAIIELGFETTDRGNIRLVFDIQEKLPCVIMSLKFETANTDLKALLKSHFKSDVKKP